MTYNINALLSLLSLSLSHFTPAQIQNHLHCRERNNKQPYNGLALMAQEFMYMICNILTRV